MSLFVIATQSFAASAGLATFPLKTRSPLYANITQSSMHNFTPYSALIGGALIGLASSLFLLAHGRICGISGIFGGLLTRGAGARGVERDSKDVQRVRVAFVGGLLFGGLLLALFYPSVYEATWSPSWMLAAGAGLLVGFGTHVGNGCTSGHGVCGISRLSPRSLIATCTFMLAGFLTVFVTRHVLAGLIGGAP